MLVKAHCFNSGLIYSLYYFLFSVIHPAGARNGGYMSDTNTFRRVFPSAVPNVSVLVHKVRTSNARIRIVARAIDSNTGERIQGVAEAQHIIRSSKQLEDEARAMVGRIETNYRKAFPKSLNKAGKKLPKGPFSQAYMAIADPSILCNPSWADSTKQSTLSDLQYVLAQMDKLDVGLDVCDADMQVVLDEMINRAMVSKNSSKRLENVSKGINSRIQRAGTAYHNLRQLHIEYPLPDVRFPKSNMASDIQPEQCKALSDETRIKLATLLLRLIHNPIQSDHFAVAIIRPLKKYPRFADCHPTVAAIPMLPNCSAKASAWN